MGIGLSTDELRLAIVLLAETKGSVANVKALEKELKTLETDARRTKSALTGLFNSGKVSEQQYIQRVNQVNKALGEVPQQAAKAGKGLFSLTNVARTALGTFEAMAIFLITRFIGEAITKTINSLKQLELSFYKISIAEASLSKAGVDIIPQDLLDIAKEIAKTFNYVSDIDAMKIVGQVSLLTKDLKLTKEQIRSLSMAIPALARSTGESIEETTAAIATGIAKNGRGLADQNVQVNAQIISQKAVELGLVASEEAYKNLTAEQKQYVDVSALVSIISDAASESLQKQGEMTDTVTEKTGIITAEWENFLTKTGVTFAPFIKSGLDLIIKGLQLLGYSLKGVMVIWVFFVSGVVGYAVALRGILDGSVKSISEYIDLVRTAGLAAGKLAYQQMSIPQAPTDTPTGNQPTSPEDVVAPIEDIQGALDKAREEILKSELKLEQDLTDVAIDLGRKMVDITEEYAKKRADAYSDYNNKIADINRDLKNKLENIDIKEQERRAKAKNDELQKEKEFQNKLQEMKEKFLMDLDDALHARDARQILKLIKQYNLEKLQAERSHALDKTNAKKEEQLRQQQYIAERKQAEKEAREKLADAQRDYQLKLTKLKADEDAEVAAAVKAANRKTEDLLKSNQDRLAIIGADLVLQFNLTKKGLDDILNLYRQYYGSGGYISQVMAGMSSMLTGQMSPQGQLMNGGTPPARTGGRPSTSSGGGGSSGHNRAEGGTMIANKATNITFGEAGLEMATFTPIGRNGKDVNKIFSNIGGGGGSSSGMISIEMLLSPDLESRIVKNTLGQTAEIIMRTSRSK